MSTEDKLNRFGMSALDEYEREIRRIRRLTAALARIKPLGVKETIDEDADATRTNDSRTSDREIA